MKDSTSVKFHNLLKQKRESFNTPTLNILSIKSTAEILDLKSDTAHEQ